MLPPIVLQCSVSAARRLISVPRRFHVVRSSLPPISVPRDNYVKVIHKDIDRFSDRAAIINDVTGESFSYTQLQQATLSVASELRKSGLDFGSRVTLFTDNRPEFVFALHGAVAGGCVASPINCHYTAGELEHPLRDANTSVVITDKERLPTVKAAASRVSSVQQVYLIGETETASRELGCLPFDRLLQGPIIEDFSYVDVDADNDLAYLLYSSGTSGLPKGVMLTHSNVSSNVLMVRALLENEVGKEVVAATTPFFHAYGITVIAGNMIQNCGTIVILPKFEPESFLASIEKYRIDQLLIVPPLVLFLLQHPSVKNYDLSSIRRIMSGSAPLGKEVETALAEKFPNCDILQGYGLTECSAACMICPPNHRRPKDGFTIGSVGISAPSQEAKVVDPETNESLPAGQVGEITIRGPHVMKGYLGLPEATSACIDKDGWFYSGDIGYYDENNHFFITDRLKELIKYKGTQVAPAEVESVLLSHPSIADCAVVGRKNIKVGEETVAFIVRQNENLTEENIHDFVKSQLAPHKQLHGGIIFVDSVPRSPSGKLLRRFLRDQINK